MVQSEVIQRVLRITYGKHSGTAFTLENKGVQYLITARHLFESHSHTSEGTIEILTNIGYISHKVDIKYPVDANVDIAILKVKPYRLLTPVFENSNSTKGLIFGQDVYFLGFPYEYHNLLTIDPSGTTPVPFIKKACLSTILANKTHDLLLDGHNNPGFSGGPVCYMNMSATKNLMTIAGVISGYRFDKQRILNEKGEETSNYTKANSGIIIAYDIRFAIEVIENWK